MCLKSLFKLIVSRNLPFRLLNLSKSRFIAVYLFSFYVKERSSICLFTPQMPAKPGTGHAEARSPQLHLGGRGPNT